MLQAFLVQNFDELVSRTKVKAAARRSPSASAPDLETGVPLLLAQLGDVARRETSTSARADRGIRSTAARHARALLEKGWSVSEVVHDYGDVRLAIMELAAEKGAAVGLEELGALSRCLDTATAEAVAEYGHLKEEATSHREAERLGQVGHDLRTQLQTALLSFQAVKTGKAGKTGIDGSAGDALSRSLERLRDLID